MHESWRQYFEGSSGSSVAQSDVDSLIQALRDSGLQATAGGVDVKQMQADGMKMMTFIRAFMTHGHIIADTDPLKLHEITEAADKFKKPT